MKLDARLSVIVGGNAAASVRRRAIIVNNWILLSTSQTVGNIMSLKKVKYLDNNPHQSVNYGSS